MTAPSNGEKAFGQTPHAKAGGAGRALPLGFYTTRRHGARPVFWAAATTAVACVRLNRKCVGIEMEEAHAKLATKRIEQTIKDLTNRK